MYQLWDLHFTFSPGALRSSHGCGWWTKNSQQERQGLQSGIGHLLEFEPEIWIERKPLWYFDHNLVKMIRNAEGKSQRIEVFWKEIMILQCCSLRASFTFLKMRMSTMPLIMKNPHIVICWAWRRKVYSAHQPVKNCCQWKISSNRVFLMADYFLGIISLTSPEA